MVMDGRELVESLRSQVQEIDIQGLKSAMKNNSRVIVIDIREVSETSAGYVPNSLLIPRGILEMQLNSHEDLANIELLAEQAIYLICCSGARSILSAFSLQQMGYKNVYSVAGGFLAWQAAGYEFVH